MMGPDTGMARRLWLPSPQMVASWVVATPLAVDTSVNDPMIVMTPSTSAMSSDAAPRPSPTPAPMPNPRPKPPGCLGAVTPAGCRGAAGLAAWGATAGWQIG